MSWKIAGAALLLGITWVHAEDLAKDGGFEDDVIGMAGPNAETWGRFASADPMGLLIAEDPLKSSNQVLRFEARPELAAYQGIFQKVPVEGGATYVVTMKILDDATAPLSEGSVGKLSIEWFDASGQEVGREDGESCTAGISSKKWDEVTFDGIAPAGAASAHFVILQKNAESEGRPPGGAFFVDDFSVVKK